MPKNTKTEKIVSSNRRHNSARGHGTISQDKAISNPKWQDLENGILINMKTKDMIIRGKNNRWQSLSKNAIKKLVK